jgi:GntR family transcriptional regulator
MTTWSPGGRPKYGQIADQLREAISSGQYPTGSTLPAITELMTQYGVARDTVRGAINLLANEGLVTPQRGVGTVVRDTEPVSLNYTAQSTPQTWQQQTAGAGQDVVITTGWENADEDIASRLQIPPGSEVVHRVRHFTKGSGIAQVTDQWIPKDVAEAVAGTGAGNLAEVNNRPDHDRNLFELMSDGGRAPAETTETIHTRMPDPTERITMDVPLGIPVLVTTRVTRDNQGRPVETTTACGAGDRMSAQFTLKLNY